MPHGTSESLRLLLAGAIDYAGLFPPAALEMRPAVSNYAAYREGAHSWLLGRFVVPVARLAEFAHAAGDHLRRGDGAMKPWRIAALIGEDARAELAAALSFNCSHWSGSELGHALIDVVELKVATPAELAERATDVPRSMRAYFEIPLDERVQEFVRTAATAGAGIKARTGGITENAFPAPDRVAAFLAAAAREAVPCKVTAGLHHLIRGEYRLTYEPGSACGPMFGFLNVFAAAALAVDGAPPDELAEVLTETDQAAVRFSANGLQWRERQVSNTVIMRARELLGAFGSCSFSEPVEELAAAGLIE